MGVQLEQLFRVALGLAEPWVVSKIEFSQEKQQLELWLDFPAGSRFACPECERAGGVYDTAERTWRHLNFFQHKTFLHARQPRIDCPDHGIRVSVGNLGGGCGGIGLKLCRRNDSRRH